MSFSLERSLARPTGVLVEVPHAGLEVPEGVDDALVRDADGARRDADLFVDALYADAPSRGATLLCARVSRHVVDLNRLETDVDGLSCAGAPGPDAPRGVVWREASDGRRVLSRALTRAEFDARIDGYFRPYHRALEEEIKALRARCGRVILVSAHSMPSHGADALGRRVRRADVVPGTRGRRTADAPVIDLVERHFRAAGMSVSHDDPYRGGATTARWGRAHEGVHAVQIELNRALYMREERCEPKPEAMEFLRGVCASLLTRLGEL